MKIHVVADIPDVLAQEWLQHLRDFDTAHPSCHFEVMADAPQMSVAEMVEAIRLDPKLDVHAVIERKRF
jgi:hypothetical protein